MPMCICLSCLLIALIDYYIYLSCFPVFFCSTCTLDVTVNEGTSSTSRFEFSCRFEVVCHVGNVLLLVFLLSMYPGIAPVLFFCLTVVSCRDMLAGRPLVHDTLKKLITLPYLLRAMTGSNTVF